ESATSPNAPGYEVKWVSLCSLRHAPSVMLQSPANLARTCPSAISSVSRDAFFNAGVDPCSSPALSTGWQAAGHRSDTVGLLLWISRDPGEVSRNDRPCTPRPTPTGSSRATCSRRPDDDPRGGRLPKV